MIVNVKAREIGTPSNAIRSTTDGLTNGYQITDNTTMGASAVATTGGFLIVEIANLPSWYSTLPIEQESNVAEELRKEDEKLANSYNAMAGENLLIAEESLNVAMETWPSWED
jgi:hypothetical protein